MTTKEQIRTALIEIAEALGRPHYEPLTVREVLASFDTGADHPLKAEVLKKINGGKSAELVAPCAATEEPVRSVSRREIKQAILELAQHGTITKFKNGCRCEECMEWA